MSGPRYVTPYAYAPGSTGAPIPGALLGFFLTTSDTPAATYSDVNLTIANTNPVVANAAGIFPSIFLDPTITYRVVESIPSDGINPPIEIWTADPVGGPSSEEITSVVNVKDFGAVGNGIADDTVALQAALNYVGTNGGTWYVPDGKFKFTALVMPTRTNVEFAGNGVSSILVQVGSGLTWPGNSVIDVNQTMRDLAFDGTSGTGDTIDATGIGQIDFRSLFFNNIPVGFSSLYTTGSRVGGIYTHDVRLSDLRVYSTTAGHSFIRFGPTSSDGQLTFAHGNCGVTSSYCLYMDSGAVGWQISDFHVYNAAISVVHCAGFNSNFIWTNCRIEYAPGGDLMYLNNSSFNIFIGCWFNASFAGFSQVTLDESFGNVFMGCSFVNYNVTGMISAVREINGSSDNSVLMAMSNALADYANIFDLSGAQSFARGLQNYAPYGTMQTLVGVAAAAQAQNSTAAYGPNGADAAPGNAVWAVPFNGQLLSATLAVDITPAAGQTFTFNILQNGSTVAGGTLVVNHGGFGGTLKFDPPIQLTQGDELSIQSIFSATSGSASPRYNLNIQF